MLPKPGMWTDRRSGLLGRITGRHDTVKGKDMQDKQKGNVFISIIQLLTPAEGSYAQCD